jgi:hypothetical protein
MNTSGSFLSAPPREMPGLMPAQILFGGSLAQFGWLFFGFGMLFVWLFGSMADPGPILFNLATLETAPGTVSDVRPTNSSQNDVPVYAIHFTYRVESEETDYFGVSYTTGAAYSVGQPVTVEYVASNPDRARIKGERSGQFDWWVLCIVGIFPLVGSGFILYGLTQGWKNLRLLRYGQVARGQLARKEPTNTRINKRMVYKLTFDFTAADGAARQAIAKSHLPGNLEDEAYEQILYDPANPTRAALVDNLPGAPDIDDLGRIYMPGGIRGTMVLILPMLVTFGNGCGLLAALTRLL